jgi:hypothetical protein
VLGRVAGTVMVGGDESEICLVDVVASFPATTVTVTTAGAGLACAGLARARPTSFTGVGSLDWRLLILNVHGRGFPAAVIHCMASWEECSPAIAASLPRRGLITVAGAALVKSDRVSVAAMSNVDKRTMSVTK